MIYCKYMRLSRSFAQIFMLEMVGIVTARVGLVRPPYLVACQHFCIAHTRHIHLVVLLIDLNQVAGTVCLLYSLADERQSGW